MKISRADARREPELVAGGERKNGQYDPRGGVVGDPKSAFDHGHAPPTFRPWGCAPYRRRIPPRSRRLRWEFLCRDVESMGGVFPGTTALSEVRRPPTRPGFVDLGETTGPSATGPTSRGNGSETCATVVARVATIRRRGRRHRGQRGLAGEIPTCADREPPRAQSRGHTVTDSRRHCRAGSKPRRWTPGSGPHRKPFPA